MKRIVTVVSSLVLLQHFVSILAFETNPSLQFKRPTNHLRLGTLPEIQTLQSETGTEPNHSNNYKTTANQIRMKTKMCADHGIQNMKGKNLARNSIDDHKEMNSVECLQDLDQTGFKKFENLQQDSSNIQPNQARFITDNVPVFAHRSRRHPRSLHPPMLLSAGSKNRKEQGSGSKHVSRQKIPIVWYLRHVVRPQWTNEHSRSFPKRDWEDIDMPAWGKRFVQENLEDEPDWKRLLALNTGGAPAQNLYDVDNRFSSDAEETPKEHDDSSQSDVKRDWDDIDMHVWG